MIKRVLGLALSVVLSAALLSGCGGAPAASRPGPGQAAGGAPPASAPGQRPQAGQPPAAPGQRPQAGQGLPATGQRPQAGQPPAAPGQRPQAGQGPVSGTPGEGITVTVTEEQLNGAIDLALKNAADSSISALSVDLQPDVVYVSASVVVEGSAIDTRVGLAPAVQDCALSFVVVEEPSQPSGIPAPLWDSVVDQVVTAIESAVVAPQGACIRAVQVGDGQMGVTVSAAP